MKKIEVVIYECENCGGDSGIACIYSPPFVDAIPLCPYCQAPLTNDYDKEQLTAQLSKVMDTLAKEAA